MKRIVMIALMVAVSMPCFASKRHSADIYFSSAVRVGTTTLRDGKYSMEWVASGTDAQVSFFLYTDAANFVLESKPSVTVHATLTPADNIKTVTSSQHPGFTELQRGGVPILDKIQMPHLTIGFAGATAN